MLLLLNIEHAFVNPWMSLIIEK